MHTDSCSAVLELDSDSANCWTVSLEKHADQQSRVIVFTFVSTIRH